MINLGHLLGLSIIAVCVDRFVLDRCLGKGTALPSENPLKRSLSLGGCVTGVLLCASLFTGLAMDMVLTPIGVDYLLPVVFVIGITAVSLGAEFLFSIMRPFAPLHRMFARTTALCAILVLPLLAPLFGTFEQQYLLFRKSMILGGSAGIAFTIALLLFSGITQAPVFDKKERLGPSLSLELLTGALLLLACSGISSFPLFNW
jgi:Na+-translocating ferredoxin:NAD+ oxidoreductase RnfA subunit